MAGLRRTLVDDQVGNRYIAAVPGLGYGFSRRSHVEEARPVAVSAVTVLEKPTHEPRADPRGRWIAPRSSRRSYPIYREGAPSRGQGKETPG